MADFDANSFAIYFFVHVTSSTNPQLILPQKNRRLRRAAGRSPPHPSSDLLRSLPVSPSSSPSPTRHPRNPPKAPALLVPMAPRCPKAFDRGAPLRPCARAGAMPYVAIYIYNERSREPLHSKELVPKEEEGCVWNEIH